MVSLAYFKPHIAQVAVQICYAVMNIITRVALDDGMNPLIYVAYRQAVATLAIAPFAYFLERKERPAMTCAIFWQIFFLGLVGITLNQNFYFEGLAYTTPTFASATTNLIPVVTFVMATTFGLEKVNIRTMRGQAKVLGTLVCVGGAMVMTVYKGPVLATLAGALKTETWTLGAILLFASCCLWSGWLTFQTPVVKKYPTQQSLTALMIFCGAIQSFVIAAIFERRASAWKLKLDMELLSIVYSVSILTYGVLSSAFAFFIQTYCIKEKGPVFAAVFNPLNTILVAILEYFILHVNLHVGSVVGAVLIIAGLYTVLWGKANDQINVDSTKDATSDNNNIDYNIEIKQPLLENEASNETPSHLNNEISA
eukprot:Gb_23338 [translate_table: standard]